MIDKSDEEKSHSKPRSWLERLTTLLAREPKTREQLMEVLRDAQERDVLSSEMLGMIERILQVSEMQVREVMVPKAQMVVLEKGDERLMLQETTTKDSKKHLSVVAAA